MSASDSGERRLSPELRERALVLADKIVLDLELDGDDLVTFGVDLLLAGHDGLAVVALASMLPGSRWIDVEPPARSALDELGIRLPAPDAAGWSLALYWARQLEIGGPRTYDRAAALWGLWWTLDAPPEIAALVSLMDEWEATVPGTRREPIEAEMTLLAGPIIDAAEHANIGRDRGGPDDEDQR